MTVKEWMRENGIKDQEELFETLREHVSSGTAPALCEEGCEVEPDGECPHGRRSILLVLGMC